MRRKLLILSMVVALCAIFNRLSAQNIKVNDLTKGVAQNPTSLINLVPADRNSSDNFGENIAVSGDVMVVGAPNNDYDSAGSNSVSDAGAAYIYYRNSSNGSWDFVKKITGVGTNGRVASDNFGSSVAIDGDVIIVGAYLQDYDSAGGNSLSGAGAAYIYYKNSGGADNWGFVKKLTGKGTNGRVSSDNFGFSVAISGDLVVVGAIQQYYDSAGANSLNYAGAAYVFNKTSGGTDNWGFVKKLTGKGTNGRLTGDFFGSSVSISGDAIVVGAYGQSYDSAGANSLNICGAAYVFYQNSGGTDNWGFVKKLTGKGTNGRVANDYFGVSVSISGDVIVAGAEWQDYDSAGGSNISAAGAAWVFNKNSGGTDNWGVVKKLTGKGTNGRVANDHFGNSVAISGDLITVGAYGQSYDSAGGNSISSAGAAWVFNKNSGGTDNWGAVKKVTGTGTNGRVATDFFGSSVAISGDVLVVGANYQDYDSTGFNFTDGAGAANTFYKSSGGTDNWGAVEKICAQYNAPGYVDRNTNDSLGYSVAISGNVMVVGAHSHDYDSAGSNIVTDAGAAYIYYYSSGSWNLVKKLVASGTNGRIAGDNFGNSVAIDGDLVIVGAYNQDYDATGANSVTNAGAAYIFSKDQGGTDNWGLVKKVVGSGTNSRLASDNFGVSVSISGSIAIVGANYQDYDESGANFVNNAGAAYIFSKNTGGSNNWGLVKKVIASGTNGRNSNDQLGYSVAISGSVAIVGDYNHDYDSAGVLIANNAGAALVFSQNQGGSNNWGLVKKLTGKGTNGAVLQDNFGNAVAIDGDIAVIGAYRQDYDATGASSVTNAGAAYIFNKNSGGTDNWGFMKKLAGVGTNSRISNDNFGWSVAISGNAVLVGSNLQSYDSAGSNSSTSAGAVYEFYRYDGGIDNWGFGKKITGNNATNGRVAGDKFGYSVAISGDLLAVGAPAHDYDSLGANNITDAGAIYAGSLSDYLVYNSGAWSTSAPGGSSGSYNTYIYGGSPALAAGALVKEFFIDSTATPSIASGTVTVQGTSYVNRGTFSGAGSITLGGSSAITIAGDGATNNLILNNALGATISSTSTDSLIITGVYTHTAGALTTNGKLKLKATGATTYGQIAGTGTGTISGNVIAEYQVPTGDEAWRPVSSPLNGATLAQLEDDFPLNYGSPNSLYTTVFTFNESRSPSWQTPSSTTSMDDSCFSIYMGRNSWLGGIPAYIDITGTYGGTSDYTKNNLTKTGGVSDTSGWHYMRNPWPSAFVWDGTISNVQGNQIYLYDQNGGAGGFYRVYDNTNQGAVPPFAALLFQVTANNVSVTLPNSQRNTDSLKNVFDKTFPLDNYVELGIQKEGQPVTDYVKFYTDNAASNNFDALDGIKKLNDPIMPSMYFTTGIDKLNKHAYNNIPTGTTKLPILFQTTTNGKYIINPRIENLDADVEVFIEDLQNNILTPVNTAPIEINYTGSGIAGRYNLVFSKKSINTGTQTATSADAINMAQVDGVLFINANLPANTQITITDILGRVMMQQTIQDATQGITQMDVQQLAAGYYIVTLNGDTVHYSQKIVVN